MVSPHFSVLFRQKWQVACGHLQLLTEELFREALFLHEIAERAAAGSAAAGGSAFAVAAEEACRLEAVLYAIAEADEEAEARRRS